ncbi:MAG: anti-sigma factor [Bacteroidota bacterium]
MDIKNYISSGILEQYVLGIATDAERQEVQQLAQKYPEVRQELDAIEVAMEQYAKIHELEKPVGVEAKFNQRIDELIAKNPPPPSSDPDQKSGGGGLWLPILLVGALLGSLWWGYTNQQNFQQSESQLSAVTDELSVLQADCDTTRAENDALKNQIQILQNPDNQNIKISKLSNAQQYASIIWNPQSRKSYIFNVDKLSPPPTGKQYQLWAIVDGAPVDMKPIPLTVDEDGLIEVDFIENPSAFAISLEDIGGSTAPTDVIAVQPV